MIIVRCWAKQGSQGGNPQQREQFTILVISTVYVLYEMSHTAEDKADKGEVQNSNSLL